MINYVSYNTNSFMPNKQQALINISSIIFGAATLLLYYTTTKPMPSIIAYLGWFGFISSIICLIFNLKDNGE